MRLSVFVGQLNFLPEANLNELIAMASAIKSNSDLSIIETKSDNSDSVSNQTSSEIENIKSEEVTAGEIKTIDLFKGNQPDNKFQCSFCEKTFACQSQETVYTTATGSVTIQQSLLNYL